MFELLALAFLFLAVIIFGFIHGYRTWQDERARKRIVAKWKESRRVRALLRLIKGGKDKEK